MASLDAPVKAAAANGFGIFLAQQRASLASAHPSASPEEIADRAVTAWNGLSEQEREGFSEQASEASKAKPAVKLMKRRRIKASAALVDDESSDEEDEAAKPKAKTKAQAQANAKAKAKAKAAPKVHPFFGKVVAKKPKPAAQTKSASAAKQPVAASAVVTNGSAPAAAAAGAGGDDGDGDEADVTEGKAGVAGASGSDSEVEDEDEDEAMDSSAGAISAGTYHPVADAQKQFPEWKLGSDVPYKALATVWKQIEDDNITKRLVLQRMLTDLFRSVIAISPQDLLPTVYLCINKLAPAFEGVELGVGDSFIKKAVTQSTGRKLKDLNAAVAKTGDLGLVAEQSRGKQSVLMKPKPLTVRAVLKEYRQIANEKGAKSADRRVGRIKKLLVAASGEHGEPRFIVRGLQGNLRVKLGASTVQVALAHAIAITPAHNPAWADADEAARNAMADPPAPTAGGVEGCYAARLDARLSANGRPRPTETVAKELETAMDTFKQVFSELPSYDKLVPLLLAGGVPAARAGAGLTSGIPVSPMLAKPTKGISEVLDRLGDNEFTCEFKYDGERAQVHRLADGSIHIFSRNSENMTEKYPDMISVLPRALCEGTSEFILDGEAVAYDREQKVLLPFQQLSTRARKGVTQENVKVNVIYVPFDLLSLNGRSLLREPLRERRRLMHEGFQEVEGLFQFARYEDCRETEEIQTLMDKAVQGNCEGLMVKTLDANATYEPSKRSLNWLKLKKDYMDGVTDTLDLVPVGAWFGKGKRTGVFGAYLLACFDQQEETFQTITRIGTGFSDERLQQFHKAFTEGEKIRAEKPPTVDSDEKVKPDVWLEPCQVWEVQAADLSISPQHRAAVGLVHADKGIALRFPRLLRLRDDKEPEQATSAEQVADMYQSQPVVAGRGAQGGR